MILLSTQEVISPIKSFLTAPIPYGVVTILLLIIIIATLCVLILRPYYKARIKKLEDQNRSLERGIADLEAKDAQVIGELEDLRKAEAILIHRNGVLEAQVEEDGETKG